MGCMLTRAFTHNMSKTGYNMFYLTYPTTMSSPYLMGGPFSGLIFSLLLLVVSTGLLCSLLPLPPPAVLLLPFSLLLPLPLTTLSLALLLASFGVCFSGLVFFISSLGGSSLGQKQNTSVQCFGTLVWVLQQIV